MQDNASHKKKGAEMRQYSVDYDSRKDAYFVVNLTEWVIDGPFNYAAEAQERADYLNKMENNYDRN